MATCKRFESNLKQRSEYRSNCPGDPEPDYNSNRPAQLKSGYNNDCPANTNPDIMSKRLSKYQSEPGAEVMAEYMYQCNPNQKSENCKIETMALAMAYVPWQYFDKVYELDTALQYGTIFPELNKPWEVGC
jgi:hypothetical protein